MVDYNRMRTSLNHKYMFEYSNQIVLWKYLEEDRKENVTTMSFVNNFLYFSNRVEEIIVEVMDLLSKNTAENVKNKLLQDLVNQLDKNAMVLQRNFPVL